MVPVLPDKSEGMHPAPVTPWQVAAKEEVPLAYLPGNQSRFLIRIIGDLDLTKMAGMQAEVATPTYLQHPSCPPLLLQPQPSLTHAAVWGGGKGAHATATRKGGEGHAHAGAGAVERVPGAGGAAILGRGHDPSPAHLAAWQALVDGAGEWVVHDEDVHLISIGTGILGTGGGGSPERAKLKALIELQRWQQMQHAALCMSCLQGDGFACCRPGPCSLCLPTPTTHHLVLAPYCYSGGVGLAACASYLPTSSLLPHWWLMQGAWAPLQLALKNWILTRTKGQSRLSSGQCSPGGRAVKTSRGMRMPPRNYSIIICCMHELLVPSHA